MRDQSGHERQKSWTINKQGQAEGRAAHDPVAVPVAHRQNPAKGLIRLDCDR